MALQTLPPLANTYTADQLSTIDRLEQEVAARWAAGGPQFDNAWAVMGPLIVAAVLQAQGEIADRATAFIPAILADTGQTTAVMPEAEPFPAGFVGWTGAGILVEQLLAAVAIRAKEAVAAGATAAQAAALAQDWLVGSVATILADTARGAEGLGMYVRPVGGYVRIVHGGACGRCVILAGRWYRTNAGFERHPRCRCTHIPASEALAGHWQSDPRAYFDSLTDAQRIKLMGSKANAQAVLDGADMGQVINAYRKSTATAQSPIKRTPAGLFTSEGTTRRGLAGQQQAGLRRNGPSQLRLMPESIAKIATSREDRLRLLRLYGWIADDTARARGREILARA